MSLRNLTFVALFWAFALNASLPTASAAKRREPFELRDGDRVVLLGGTFFERAQRYGYLETEFQLRFPDRKFSVRNLGWSGDTVFAESRGIFDAPAKGYARMIEQVKGLKPTVIFLHYGGNEAFNGDAYLDTFVKQYEKLLDDLAPTGAELVLFSPRPLFHLPPPLPDPTAQNELRREYGSAIQKLAERRGLRFVSLYPLLKTDLRQAQGESARLSITDDGLHLNDLGYKLVSTLFEVKTFGPRPLSAKERLGTQRVEIDADGTLKQSHGCEVLNPRATTEGLTFEVRFEHPLSMLAQLKVNGLRAGEYELKIDGKPLNWKLTETQLAEDFRTDGRIGRAFIGTTHDELREAVIEKNEMYFHRWRPQNVTYLFLFRKHEQGNNAKEVEEFEQIVAKLDDRIFELKQKAAEVTVEIVRVGDADSDK